MASRLIVVVGFTLLLVLPIQGQEQGRGYLGIMYEMALDGSGIVVLEVVPNTPAEKANLMVGDVISKVNDKRMNDGTTFANTIAGYRPGTKVTLGVVRNGKEEKIPVVLAKRAEGQ